MHKNKIPRFTGLSHISRYFSITAAPLVFDLQTGFIIRPNRMKAHHPNRVIGLVIAPPTFWMLFPIGILQAAVTELIGSTFGALVP
jgi:hypothetical protein